MPYRTWKNGDVVKYLTKEEFEEFYLGIMKISLQRWGINRFHHFLSNQDDYQLDFLRLHNELDIKRFELWDKLREILNMPTNLIIGFANTSEYGEVIIDGEPETHSPYYIEEGTVVDNVHELKPKDGTIIGKLKAKELKECIAMRTKYDALLRFEIRCNTYEDFDKYMKFFTELEERNFQLWEPIRKRLNAPFDWELQADIFNGDVYVRNYEKPYEEDSYDK